MLNIKNIIDVGPGKWFLRNLVRQYYKRVLKKAHAMMLPTGHRMLLPLDSDFASECFVANADVDWGSESLLFSNLENRGAFLDIGSHIGYYSLYMLPRVQQVYAFEPDPRARVILQENLYSHASTQVVPHAVGNRAGMLGFVLEDSSAVSHLASGSAPSMARTIQVQVVTVDDFVRDQGLLVEAIKIDVEGFDFEVLIGARKTLVGQAPLVLTEVRVSRELLEFTASIDYKIYAFCRKTHTRRKQFVRIDQPPLDETKMLFLVPDRLRQRFDALTVNSRRAFRG